MRPNTSVMHKRILFQTILTILIFTSCGDKRKDQQQALEKDYAALFEKDYAEFQKSDVYKRYEERYNEICQMADRIYLADSLPVTGKDWPKEALHFQPEEDVEWQMEMKRSDDYINNIIKVYPYGEYVNGNEGINAVFVSSEFCRGGDEMTPGKTYFDTEEKFHQAYNALNKEKFVAQCQLTDSLPSSIYDRFCKARLHMDMLLRAKYLLVLKQELYTPWEYDAGSSIFTTALYVGTVYIYDISQKKLSNSFTVFAMNSDEVEGIEYTLEGEIRNDLNRNLESNIKHSLDSLVGVNGEVPGLYISFPLK